MFLQAAAAAKASSRAWKSWPSTGITFQLKAANFLSNGSEGITSAVAPSICRPFTSTMAHRLSRRYLAAAMAASHTWPSSISPSPSRVYTR